jgi:hypothetical protein
MFKIGRKVQRFGHNALRAELLEKVPRLARSRTEGKTVQLDYAHF